MYKLRPYQQTAADLILANIDKKQLMELPTGGGKTVIAAHVIKELTQQGNKVFFVVAGQELVLQSYNKFVQSGIRSSVIKAGLDKHYSPHADCQVVMIQSYTRRADKLPDITPDVIIIDEVDYGYTGGMLGNLLQKYPNSKIIGLTATPMTDKGYLLPGFDIYHAPFSVRDLQNQGYLSIDKNYVPFTPDLSGVSIKTTGDFNDEELDTACNQAYVIDDIIKTYKQKDQGFKGICFAINIQHGETLQNAFNNAEISCGLVHSKMKNWQVKYWMDSHKAGRIRMLVNVGMLTRGYDDVNIIDILVARPTMSERLYKQIIGRAARLDLAGLNYFRHFDFAGNIERFGLWSELRMYSLDELPKRKAEFEPIICPGCWITIYERSSTCPECGWDLVRHQEARERKIEEVKRVEQVVEILSATGSEGAISALNTIMPNGNTFYFTKLYGLKPLNMADDLFNNEVKRLAKHCSRQGHKPMYVYFKLQEKLKLANMANV